MLAARPYALSQHATLEPCLSIRCMVSTPPARRAPSSPAFAGAAARCASVRCSEGLAPLAWTSASFSTRSSSSAALLDHHRVARDCAGCDGRGEAARRHPPPHHHPLRPPQVPLRLAAGVSLHARRGSSEKTAVLPARSKCRLGQAERRPNCGRARRRKCRVFPRLSPVDPNLRVGHGVRPARV